ncbi:hypothetical protein J3E68DRAFT_447952 [Trichoderma sp. SZMC 28012]
MEPIARNQATAAQIQSLEDAAQNPLTGKSSPQGHRNILQGRRQLPVYGRYQEILDNYHKSQVMILSSESGSVIDEAHERTVDLDLLLAPLKRVIPRQALQCR